MNPMTLALGLFIVCYSIVSTALKLKYASKVPRLARLRVKYGEKKGTQIFLFGNAALPLVIGLVLVVMGWRGQRMF